MKIVLLVMTIIICFLICLVVYFWSDRNFYRNATKFWRKHCKDCIDICYKNCLDWAKAYAELQEENEKLQNQLAESEKEEDVK